MHVLMAVDIVGHSNERLFKGAELRLDGAAQGVRVKPAQITVSQEAGQRLVEFPAGKQLCYGGQSTRARPRGPLSSAVTTHSAIDRKRLAVSSRQRFLLWRKTCAEFPERGGRQPSWSGPRPRERLFLAGTGGWRNRRAGSAPCVLLLDRIARRQRAPWAIVVLGNLRVLPVTDDSGMSPRLQVEGHVVLISPPSIIEILS